MRIGDGFECLLSPVDWLIHDNIGTVRRTFPLIKYGSDTTLFHNNPIGRGNATGALKGGGVFDNSP